MADAPGVSVDTLVIACGNPLRGDDGIGPVVAEQVRAALSDRESAGTRIVITHQLLPEHALELADARQAVLIDARIPQDEPIGIVRLDRAEPERHIVDPTTTPDAKAGLTHHWTLPRLLAIAEKLYGRAPEAYTVSVATDHFDLTDALSQEVEAAIPQMRDRVLEIIRGSR